MAILGNPDQFMYPITPSGEASLMSVLTDPTHRISGNSLILAFETDPEVLREYIPEPLELDGSGLVYLRAYEGWVYTDRHKTETIREERTSYCEVFFWVPCTLNGEPYHYLLYSWVNRDWLAFLGRHAGQPHKIADVQLTRFHPADPVYNEPGAGKRVGFSVELNGSVLRAHCDLKEEVEYSETILPYGKGTAPKYLGHRYFYGICEERPLVSDLVAHWGDAIEMGTAWTGPAEVEFFENENEEVAPFKPTKVLGGWWSPLAFHHKSSSPIVVHDYLNETS